MSTSRSIQQDALGLLELPLEIVLKIFNFCDLPSLGRLSQACHELRSLCADEILWRKIIRSTFLPVQGPSMGSGNTERICMVWKSLPAKTQCQLIYGFKERKMKKSRTTYLYQLAAGINHKSPLCMHRVLLDDRGIWTCSLEKIMQLPWQFVDASLTTDAARFTSYLECSDPARHIGDFTVSARYLVAGHWNGSITVVEAESTFQSRYECRPHLSDVHSVAVRDSLLFSGSRDHTVSFFDLDKKSPLLLANLDDRIWCVAPHRRAPLVAIGTSGTTRSPLLRLSTRARDPFLMEQCNLRIFDFQSEAVLRNLNRGFRHGFGILTAMFTDDNTLICGGHDGLLRIWDLREYRCVDELDSDLDSAVYCFCTDGAYTIATGHANYNAVCLWDRRYARYPIQTHSIVQKHGETKANCSVYGLCFTPFEMYIGLQDGVYRMEFCS
ncbi:F-box/WD repeat-containing protein 4-like [Paramacrobiotus metropolitanus]|uniref:F-box/WD repeat-containing protein 4-like n=1 Tax=Paramacrobiotus metropolitanus TaxID=2943436 RepID=UPI002445C706|nr:F-box/WD repeat-containing protein 4-like [Paramacrobiotus metropolitanus]